MSGKRKTLQELTIMDGFLFGAVMMDPENCRILLERILEIPIARVDVIQEKSLVYHPEYKGIRMDVFAKDEEEKMSNFEALKSAAGFVRHEIAQRINLRYSPQIIFELDDSIDYGMKIDSLIQKTKAK